MPPTLTQTIRDLLEKANAQRGRPFGTTLKHGLSVVVKIPANGSLALKLERRDVAPSAAEWITVMRHWPDPLPDPLPNPEPRSQGKRHALVARWRPPAPKLKGGDNADEDQRERPHVQSGPAG